MFFKIVTILAKLEGAFRPETPITKAKSVAFSVKQKYEKRSTKTGKKGSRVFGNLQLLLWVRRSLFGWVTSIETGNTENWHSNVISVCATCKNWYISKNSWNGKPKVWLKSWYRSVQLRDE